VVSTEIQPPQFLITAGGEHVQILDSWSCHKWLGCMLPPGGSKTSTVDIDFHVQSATRSFYANTDILCNHHVSICKCLRYYHAVLSPVAYFAAGHRAIHQIELTRLDIKISETVTFCWAAGRYRLEVAEPKFM
jgi:hypothetical protein